MKRINSKKLLCIIFIIFTLHINFVILTSKFCDSQILFKIGTKAFCESEIGISISCFKNVRKAYVQCQPGYHNEKNISQQIIECTDNGEWSEPIINCIPKCLPFLNEFKLLAINEIKFPTSYAEIVRKKPIQNETNIFPGLIVHPFKIISNKEFFKDNEYSFNFFIRLYYDSITSNKEFKVSGFGGDFDNFSYNNKTYKTFTIDDESIVYNDNIAPSCLFFEIKKELNLFRTKHIFSAGYEKKCFVPDIKEGEEAICFKEKYISHIEAISKDGKTAFIGSQKGVFREECSDSTDEVLVRCRLGYQNSNIEDKYSVNFCSDNEWQYQSTGNSECERVCGEIKPKVQYTSSRLYKGVEIDIISIPWHVGIFAKNIERSNSFEQICGGSIIHSNIVISSAHCFYNDAIENLNEPSNYIVGAGKKNRNYDVHEMAEQYNEIEKIHIPSTFRSQPVRDDIAVLILHKHFEYTSYIKPICIEWLSYNQFSISVDAWGRTVGWGSTSKAGNLSEHLLKVNLRTLSNNECKELVNPINRPDISNDKFCAINADNATACRGDSGGGFVIKRGGQNDGYYFLAGIISDGLNIKNYCSSGFISLFTNIQYHKDFINSVIDQSRGIGLFVSKIRGRGISNQNPYKINSEN